MASADTPADKSDKQVHDKERYRVGMKDNIERVSFIKSGDDESSANTIEVVFASTSNVNIPKNITFSGSSGSSINSSTFRGFQNVEYPFEGTIDYNIKPKLSNTAVSVGKNSISNSNTTNDLRCRLTFVINEPGSWIIRLSN